MIKGKRDVADDGLLRTQVRSAAHNTSLASALQKEEK
jgi:hypothetical protein